MYIIIKFVHFGVKLYKIHFIFFQSKVEKQSDFICKTTCIIAGSHTPIWYFLRHLTEPVD